ncbi:SRPBCC domain-containing protein [Flavobacterium difficile]|uniref:Polyketide cyclase n=1 Tax=Flavobacterium difficile TaxID=2709659 RepID=A0ABX0I8G0_9FLAO|nr:SRPBCC domain-containing protein [Flavobacterium difficile]NHM02450.1 polyketide cyclase [Flavobacterium difficile]
MITVSTTIKSKTLAQVWEYFTNPKHVTNWNFASDDWHCPKAENQLEIGKSFAYTMAAKNGEMSFDFSGTYTEIEEHSKISYLLEDDRKIFVTFKETENGIEVVEKFDPETENSEELQQAGWQMILDNFKKYTEAN